jgi:hypothetical protein
MEPIMELSDPEGPASPGEPKYVRSISWASSWPIPPDAYVDPEVAREYLEE